MTKTFLQQRQITLNILKRFKDVRFVNLMFSVVSFLKDIHRHELKIYQKINHIRN